ncbi:hypothetical protein [Lonepinella sp. BR2474]|uniref:hypothetical protein n=1 Tax=Lonepinella sp. BR2474 TaxID=3434548 RepID=UPI003F6E0496
MATIFTYNQNQAIKAGQSSFINETGAYTGKILLAKWTTSQGGAKALELSFETDDGMKADYLSIYYTKRDGSNLPNGENMIQAIMGCTGVKELTIARYKDSDIAPELTDKRIGLFLQKVLRTKQDGSDTHAFQILCPFSAGSRKTLAEHLENKPAERIDWLVANTKDKDDRNRQPPQQTGYADYNQVYGQAVSAPPQGQEFSDDDIPW